MSDWVHRSCLAGAGICSIVLLSGCAGDGPSLPKLANLNPFAEKQVPLPGRRVPVMVPKGPETGELADAFAPITLPSPRINDNWSQPGGEPSNAPGNLAFNGGTNVVWTANAGAGSSGSGRLTARPIIYGGNIYTLDAEGNVSAFSASGSSLWRTSLKPKRETAGGSWFSLGLGGGTDGGGFGGGLAFDNGRLYAASGFGNVVALDPQSGKALWEKQLEAPIRSSPTAVGDRVYVIALDGRFFCLAGADGGELWTVRGLPQQASLINNASPAVDGNVVVVPYPSGDLIALNISDGTSLWSENLARTRTTSQIASMSDAARPAIEGGMVFAVGHAGRMVATHADSGERLWTANVPSIQTPWVAGGSVFVVDTQGQLMALSRSDGKTQWTAKLPGSAVWAGPTLAGGNLWLTSTAGALVGVEATTGRIVTQKELGQPVYIAPVVAQGRMYVLTDKANLLAIN